MELYNGDCLEIMKTIPDKSVDFILCDLPYGVTDCKWDAIIPFDKLWEQYNRVAKEKATIALFSTQPFTTKVINSNLNKYRYNWYWIKNNKTGFTLAKKQPMRQVEDICIFVNDIRDNQEKFLNVRKYLIEERKKSGLTLKEFQKILNNTMTSHYFTMGKQFEMPSEEVYKKLQTTGSFQKPYKELLEEYKKDISKETFTYNPQGLIKIENPKIIHKKYRSDKEYIYDAKNLQKAYKKEFTNYPTNILYFKNEFGLHPTQKPVSLLEYLIKTYTDEGQTVLDNCMGSGSTGVACVNTNRKFIGIEKDNQYFETAKERIQQAERSFIMQ